MTAEAALGGRDAWVLAPLVCLVMGSVAVYLVGRLVTRRSWVLAAVTAATFVALLFCLVALALDLGQAERAGGLSPMWGCADAGGACLEVRRGGLLMCSIAAGLGLCVALYSGRYLALDRRYRTFYPLLLLMVAGLTGMVMASDLFSLYMFCELMSVTAYVLVAFRRTTDTAVEAGFKYLVMGTLGTLTLLFGTALIYRETGALQLVQAIRSPGIWARAGIACVTVGLGIKSAIVPAHTWLPDAHGRAPSSVSAMLSGVVIQSGLYALIHASTSLGLPASYLGSTLIIVSLLNMTVGNGLALVQTNTKRLLAYSTIAQMGYAMFGIGVGLRYGVAEAVQAGFFLILGHAAMKALAFLCKGICHFYCGTTQVDELRGTFRRLPLVAIAMTVALVGLAGVPPLAGFAGKWLILVEVFRIGDWLVYVGAAVFLLNTLVSLGYYVPIIAALYAPGVEELTAEPIQVSRWMAIPVVGLTVMVLVIGTVPGPWLRLTEGVLGQ